MNKRSIDRKRRNCSTGLLLSILYPSMYGHVGKEGTILMSNSEVRHVGRKNQSLPRFAFAKDASAL